MLCLYTPYTFIHIVRHSDDIEGYLMEGELDAIQPALSNIPAAERFAIRSHPCVLLDKMQYLRVEEDIEMLNRRTALLIGTKSVASLLPGSIGNLFQLRTGRRTSSKPGRTDIQPLPHVCLP